jgi:membrane-bound ClpP family serine protease
MKIRFYDSEFEISDWNPKLKVTTAIFVVITMFVSALNLIVKITVPGIFPITIGCTMFLLGIREYNIYIKENKRKLHMITGIIFTIMFAYCLYFGINQLITSIIK